MFLSGAWYECKTTCIHTKSKVKLTNDKSEIAVAVQLLVAKTVHPPGTHVKAASGLV